MFLHGLGPAGPSVVDDAAPIWADEYGFRVIAPALPGLAGSPPAPLEDYLPSTLARIVIDGGEHNLLQSRPDDVVPLVGEWLRRVTIPRA